MGELRWFLADLAYTSGFKAMTINLIALFFYMP